MAARRCDECELDYPLDFSLPNGVPSTQTCHVCGGSTKYVGRRSAPFDWQARVTKLKQERERLKREAEDSPIPRAEGELGIYGESGQFFVDDWDLRGAKISPPADHRFFLFYANGSYWESQGWHESKRRWWVEPVDASDVT